MENVWSIFVRDLCKDCNQYESKEELKEAVQKSRKEFSVDTIQKLYDLMCKSCMSIIERGGLMV